MSNRRTVFLLVAAIAMACVSLRAQSAQETNASSSVKSPVAIFRDLLAMSPAQRREAIALRPPDIQKRILEKLNEYELLPRDLSDLKLRETELRWFLRPMMDVPRENRAALLARVPQELRAQVEERLQMWDLLPPEVQERWKDNDLIASYFAQAGTVTTELLAQVPAEKRDEIEKEFEHWKTLSTDERQKALAGFKQFFELTPGQKEKTLDTVSDDERQQMQETLKSYEKLTPQQRVKCLNSFQKLALMSAAERQQFLKYAERWREMSPEEREKWRHLVTITPLLPPEDTQPPPAASTNRSLLREETVVVTN